MENIEMDRTNPTQQTADQTQRLQWEKPEAKVAEVATATLASPGQHRHPQDLATCSS